MQKVLITTAWWPTKTHCFQQYSNSISNIIRETSVETELLITTHYHESKFGSIIGAMRQAEQWALNKGFTHLFNVDADVKLPPDALDRLLADNRPILLTGKKDDGQTGLKVVSRKDAGGWGCMLVETKILDEYPLGIGYKGDFLHPDLMWFKKLSQCGVELWKDYDVKAELLEESGLVPMCAFNP